MSLTLSYTKANIIERLVLSSGIIRSPDYTIEQVVRVARLLREEHGFHGYIHLKTIPDCDPRLIEEAGRHADRLSINVEMPKKHWANLPEAALIPALIAEAGARAADMLARGPAAPRANPQRPRLLAGESGQTRLDAPPAAPS